MIFDFYPRVYTTGRECDTLRAWPWLQGFAYAIKQKRPVQTCLSLIDEQTMLVCHRDAADDGANDTDEALVGTAKEQVS